MYKNTFFTLILFILMTSVAFASAIDKGTEEFKKENYQVALQHYLDAEIDFPESQLLKYNMGTCYYKLQKYEKAKEYFKYSSLGKDTTISRNSYYNIGNTEYRMGETKQQPKEKIEQYKAAIASLKKSLEFDEEYENAKRNIEFIQIKLKEELDKHKEEKQNEQQQNQDTPPPPPPSQAAKEALAKARQLCEQELYYDGKAVLEKIIQEDETAAPFKADLQRIQDVIDINEGREPESPIENSDVDNDIGVI